MWVLFWSFERLSWSCWLKNPIIVFISTLEQQQKEQPLDDTHFWCPAWYVSFGYPLGDDNKSMEKRTSKATHYETKLNSLEELIRDQANINWNSRTRMQFQVLWIEAWWNCHDSMELNGRLCLMVRPNHLEELPWRDLSINEVARVRLWSQSG